MATQLLDGLASGIFGVLAIVIAAELTRGTGRFNPMQGIVAFAVAVGASFSSVIGGYVVQGGYRVGFLRLAAVALCALEFFLILMPDTGQDGTDRHIAAAP